MVVLTGSVGRNGKNNLLDVKKIQNLINENLSQLEGIAKLVVDGKSGPKTEKAIMAYQSTVLKMVKPDGRIDPNGKTLKSLQSNTRKPRPANVSTFVQTTLSAAKKVNLKYKIPVSIIIAQAALESGWGRSVKDNAYFGIKAHNTKGKTTTFTTTEVIKGKAIKLDDAFRAYKDFEEAALDYGDFLTSNPRYKVAFAHTKDAAKFADALQTAGYATDPDYAKKLKAIISTYYLDEYDK